MQSYSQHGEDIFIVDLFKQLGIDKPSYLDLGAHHPTEISNTRLLYENGSRGINVEANYNLFQAFKEYRPDDVNVLAAVVPPTEVGKKLDFYMFDDWSGRNTFSKLEADSFREQSGMQYQVKEVSGGVTLETIVNVYAHGIYPQFLNCDIEGFDFIILAGANYSRSTPIVVCVETRRHATREMCMMMHRQGFVPYCRMGENMIFVDLYHWRQLVADFHGYCG